MHIAQHQRIKLGFGPNYAFDVVIFDGAREVVGNMQCADIDRGDKMLCLISYLPHSVEIVAIEWGFHLVVFGYGEQVCDSDDEGHRSSLEKAMRHGYEAGNRECDIRFTCQGREKG
jgi:hypothetical protein